MIIKPDSVIGLVDGSFLVRGHLSDREVADAIRAELEPDFELDEFYQVERCYMRAIPTPHIHEYDYEYRHSEPGRGAFACTAVWV